MEKIILIRPLSLYNPVDQHRAIVFDENGLNLGVFEWQKAIKIAKDLAKDRDIDWDIETP